MASSPDLYPRIKAATLERVVSLGLASDNPAWQIGSNVYSFRKPTLDNIEYPCVQLTSEGEREEKLPGTTEHIDWLWPVRVFLLDNATGTDSARDAWYQSWRRQLMASFEDGDLESVPEVKWVAVEPEVIYNPAELPAYALVVGSFLLKFWTREPRD